MAGKRMLRCIRVRFIVVITSLYFANGDTVDPLAMCVYVQTLSVKSTGATTVVPMAG